MRRNVRINLNQDQEHLRLLAIFHFVLAVFNVLGGCFFSIYTVFGIAIVSGAFNGDRNPPPPGLGVMFLGIGLGLSLPLWSLSLAKVLTGCWLSSHRYYRFCLVVACIECVQMPLGTILGVFTIVVLMRPSVKALFAGEPVPELRLDDYDDDEDDEVDGRNSDDGYIREG